MNKLRIILILIIALAESMHAQEVPPTAPLAQPEDTTEAVLPWPQNIQARLDSLTAASPLLQTSQLGLMVYDLTADSAIYRHNERQMMRPASTMKLVTSITALDRLGWQHKYRTSLYYQGTIQGGRLNGDVYCVGGFDPMLTEDDVRALAMRLRNFGVDTLQGRIVADQSMKEAAEYGEGWCWDDDNPRLLPLTIGRKDTFTATFYKALADCGVVMEQVECTDGRLSGKSFFVAAATHTIDDVLQHMMKDSDNFYAESMFYQIAASTGIRPAKASDARNLVKRLINKLGLGKNPYRIADGSGLSLYNYVSAELETMLLRYAYLNADIYDHLYPALPIAGEDGTLKKRMTALNTRGNVHAKTGTLTGISSLAGYCTAANGHQLCFAIINQGVMRNQSGRNFQDKVCGILIEN
ncbi:MAG: D-alanyl-D-alanine carboxypeptidase/D-alanyl-D-alanine-endopeptidase [Prevotella sp.]|nr:D-alanyl-D-alanine carboxypeptidase/D-alanyl-D-alanine-endopeptidase [Prevotella sp.]